MFSSQFIPDDDVKTTFDVFSYVGNHFAHIVTYIIIYFRLFVHDPHGLYMKIESTICVYMDKCKKRLASLCPSPPVSGDSSSVSGDEQSTAKSMESVGQFVAALLDEYDALNRVCKTVSFVAERLVRASFY